MKFIITEPIYNSVLYVFVEENMDALAKHQKSKFPKYGFDPIDVTSDAAICALPDKPMGYLWIDRPFKRNSSYSISIVCHEMSHWAFHVTDNIGSKFICKKRG